jgi:hypothetical protein
VSDTITPARPAESRPPKSKLLLILVGGIVGALVAAGAIVFLLLRDTGVEPVATPMVVKTGDCIAAGKADSVAGATETAATVVDCASPDATYTVAAKINGATTGATQACARYFRKGEQFSAYTAPENPFVLCLKPKA